MPSAPPPFTLPPDTTDDLIYHSRTGDLSSLTSLLTSLSQTHSVSLSTLISSVIDTDPDGLGSGSSLLHYPSANGYLSVVEYLLAQAPPTSWVNHQNVSGNTALHWAGLNGHLDVVKVLVGAGADPGIVNAAGRDAVVESEGSAKGGGVECAEWMLRECGGLERGVAGQVDQVNGDDEGDGDGVDGQDDGEGSRASAAGS